MKVIKDLGFILGLVVFFTVVMMAMILAWVTFFGLVMG